MTRKNSLSSIYINLTVALIAFSICLLMLEGALRVIQAPRSKEAEEKIFEYDASLGWKTKVNLDTTINGEGRKVHFTTNARGFRGADVSYARTSGTPRILILGKSFAQAVQVNENELFSEQLKSLLREKKMSPAEVINAGTAAYNTDQQLLFFRSEGVRYSPDLTVLMFHDNDIWYNNHDYFLDKPKPRFILANGKLQLTRVPVPQTPAPAPPTAQKTSRNFFQRFKEWMGSHSYLYQLLRRKVRENPFCFEVAARLGLSGKNLPDVPDDFRVWKRQRDPDIQEAWKLTERLLLEIQREVKAAGSQFVVFYVPGRQSVIASHWTATRVRYGWREEDWNPNQAAEDLTHFCAQNGISLIEPTMDFIQASKHSSGPLYYAIDSHWTPEGHRVAAIALAKWVVEHRQ